MSTVADAVIKGAVGGAGFLASAYTLTKFIVATPVKIAPRGDAEHDVDVVLCFNTKKFSQDAVDFFVQMVEKQSHLIIVPKTKSVLQEHEAADEKKEDAKPEEAYYLLGATHQTLVATKEKKERALYGDVSEEPVPEHFCSGDRIDLILFELGRLKVHPTYYRPTGNHDKVDDDVAMMPEPFQDEEHGLLLQQAMHSKLLTDHFPLHDDKERSELVEKWVREWTKPQPINTVRSYFGDEVGFYFGFLGMYTQWLMPLAAVGVLTFVLDFFPSWAAYGRGLYSLLVTSWATAFLKFWKRRESTLRNEWGISTSDSLALEPTRTEFFGEKRFDPDRAKRYLVTISATMAAMAVVTVLMILYCWMEEWFAIAFVPATGWDGFWEYVYLVPSIIYSIVVLYVDAKYSELASYLTQFENHRTESDFANARVLKLALFYFVNNFGFLFYVAFKTRDMVLLEQTLSSLLITRQLLGNLQEQLMPYMSKRSSLKAEAGKLAKETHNKNAIVAKIDAELLFPTYDGTFDDYLEMFVQFGQVTLFASAYPLASLWSLFNNIMEIRSDGFKLCVSFRRSHRTSTQGIGTWYYAFSALGYLSVMTNCAIFGLHSGFLHRLFPKMSFAGSLVAVAIMEHAMVAVKVCVEMFVPDTTAAVVEAHRMRRAWLRKKASLQVELSSRQLMQTQESEGDEVSKAPPSQEEIAAADVNEWLSREKERRLKLERELKSLNDLYMGWIREEQTKRKKTELKLAALMEHVKAPLHGMNATKESSK
ncbi:Anoctamin-10 [Phytophthora nicotianae]|uniref:Anoctamin-10 n=1 Tax=Phytophthora nicotianae TaxID=4792 RepID=A0A0W8DXR1_PHYNI|nr:Anoctamin-10 [Phytophthora nicotianae]KUG01192.1 Anoctamin-10 [Phytophthora nicotianae]